MSNTNNTNTGVAIENALDILDAYHRTFGPDKEHDGLTIRNAWVELAELLKATEKIDAMIKYARQHCHYAQQGRQCSECSPDGCECIVHATKIAAEREGK